MPCFLFSHARSGKTQGQKYALAALSARKALEITDKSRK